MRFQMYIAGGYHDCSAYGIDVIEAQNELQHEIASDAANVDAFMFNNDGATRNVPHELRKRDISSHTTLAARIVQALYTAKTDNSTGNLTLTRQDIVHLNCSTLNVNCSIVYCDLSALKTQQDIGKLVMRLILNATRLKGTREVRSHSRLCYSLIIDFERRFSFVFISRYYRTVGRNEDREVQHGSSCPNYTAG